MNEPGRDGLLLVDKEPGCTSHDVVQRARRALRQKKIGHCGTLDPAATGLLVLTVGRATRLTRFLIRAPKVYEGTIRFGTVTDTYDSEGTVVATAATDELDPARIETAMQGFVGTFEQSAPPYSAKKVQGQKYYELARRGEDVPEARKEITVWDLHATAPLADTDLAFELSCSSGTYVRSVAHDLGSAVGCGAHLAALRRLKVGPFDVADAVRLADLDEPPAGAVSWWIGFDRIPLPFATLDADAQQERRILHGQAVLSRDLAAQEGDWIKVVGRSGRLLAVGSVVERIGNVGVVQPKIVFS